MHTKYTTLKQCKEELKKFGMTINRTQYGDGCRVTFARDVPGYESAERREAVAYYSDDYDDCVSTAKAMHMQHSVVIQRAAQAADAIRMFNKE